MDSTAQITDDQELAKVLENMNQQAASGGVPPIPTDDSAAPVDPAVAPVDDAPAFDQPAAPSELETPPAASEVPSVPELTPAEPAYDPGQAMAASAPTPSASPELEAIKKDALEELRPLVDKLNLPADEKFDTLLLIIRSTDDKSLVTAAHEAARAIEDEAKRAQALLDVIKEIDYFSGHGPQPV